MSGFLWHLRGEYPGRIDLKARGIAPIVDLARLFALEAGSPETATVARLRAAVDRGTAGTAAIDLAAAFDYLQQLRLGHQAARVAAGAPADDVVAFSELTELQRHRFKQAMHLVHICQESLRITYGLTSSREPAKVALGLRVAHQAPLSFQEPLETGPVGLLLAPARTGDDRGQQLVQPAQPHLPRPAHPGASWHADNCRATAQHDPLLDRLAGGVTLPPMAGIHERYERLLETGLALAAELSLPAALQRIVELAAELTGARYGALGVLGRDGVITEFITTGVSDTERAAIGHIPVGRGILGVLIDDARPLRLHDIAEDPRSVGFPANHPPMQSFLGAPVTARRHVYGNL
jgi:hypothetical protein